MLEKNGSTVLRMTFLFDLPFSSYSPKTNYQAPAIKSFLYHLSHICDTCNFVIFHTQMFLVDLVLI